MGCGRGSPNKRIRGFYGIAGSVGEAGGLARGGACAVQLRAKGTPSGKLLVMARVIRRLTNDAGILFIVNDRTDVALLADADGVHLGQDDLPLEAARRLLGPERLIGISTHSLEEVESARRGGADYIGFGPIFATTTKEKPVELQGVEKLREVVSRVDLPVVAIGGITLDNAPQVVKTGVAALTAIGAVVGKHATVDRVASEGYVEEVAERARRLSRLFA